MHPFFRHVAAVGVVCISALSVSACDICGCMSSGGSFGLLPLVNRHMVGLRCQQQAYHTTSHGIFPDSDEQFHTIDLWGRWQAHRRVQVIATLPYAITAQNLANGQQHQHANIGDASLLVQFALLAPKTDNTCAWQHYLQAGIGIKLPTGNNKLQNADGVRLHQNLQPGTGTVDYLVNALYAIQKGKFGASAEAALKLSTENDYQFQRGHSLQGGLRFFNTRKWRKWQFLPYLGALGEYRTPDMEEQDQVDDSGGVAVFATVGTEVYWKQLAFSIGCQLPLTASLSNDHVTPNTRWSAGVSYLLQDTQKTNSKLPFNVKMPEMPSPQSKQ